MLKPVQVTPLPVYRLRICYADGVEGEVDLSHLVGQGVFALWNDLSAFQKVTIGPNGEIQWNEDVELCADALYMQITGETPTAVFRRMETEDVGPLQFRLRDIFIVTLVVSAQLAAGRTFGGSVGIVEVGVVCMAFASIFVAGVVAKHRWAWIAGAAVWIVAVWIFAPALPIVRLAIAGIVCVLYALAGTPVILARRAGQRRWPWMLASASCFVVGAVVTPGDPLSMLLVAVPLCLVCILVAAIMSRQKPMVVQEHPAE